MLKLQSVERLPKNERAAVAAQVIEQLLPHPDDDDPRISDAARAVLDDARDLLRRGDEKRRATIWDYLTDVASSGAEEEDEAFKRLAVRGLLPIQSYQLVIPPTQFGNFEKLGLRRHHIVEAVADGQQRRVPALDERERTRGAAPAHQVVGTTDAFMVFAARPRVPQRVPFTLLIGTTVQGLRLVFEWGFRVYDADHDVGRALTPVDLLRSFVLRYGRTFRVNGGDWTQFVEHARVPTPEMSFTMERHPDDRRETDFFATVHFNGDRRTQTAELSLAFVIDTARYAQDLRSHGAKNVRP